MGEFFEYVVYPFLFLALYFQVFLLLTFFEREAVRRRKDTVLTVFPSVTIIVPCFNEASSIRESITSLLQLDYPREKFTIAVVDDGSTDGTTEALRMFEGHPNISLMKKANGGKHTALNVGIDATDSDFIACLDADSLVSREALKEAIAHFDNPNIAAVTASLSINKPRNMVERMQQAEYLLGIALRHILSTFNGLYVTPGPFTVYRRSVFQKLGNFTPAHNTEDMEIALRIQRAKLSIQNAPRARVYTNAPKTFAALIKQRVRWTSGFMRNAYDYRDLMGNRRYGILGLIVLPLGALSIVSGIGLFAITIIKTGESVWNFIVRATEVPLTYTLSFPSLDLFYVPVSPIALLSLTALMILFLLIVAGASISRTKTRLGLDILWYVLLYSIIAPLWLLRSVSDVALGINRSWR